MNRPRPYYGFSCLQTAEQLEAIIRHPHYEASSRRLMLGTHMSSKSLREIAVKRPKRTLTVDEVRGVYGQSFSGAMGAYLFPVIHFDSGGPDVIDAEMLLVDRLIHQPSGGREPVTTRKIFKGFQINNALPRPEYLRWFQDNHLWSGGSRFEIILQLGGYALERAGNDSGKLAETVSAYEGAIDYVLLDASGGKGLPANPEWARPFLRELRRACPWVGLGFAGGLGPDTLHLVEPLVEEFPDLSIDAESKLRDANDNFVVEKALLYLDRAIEIFEKR